MVRLTIVVSISSREVVGYISIGRVVRLTTVSLLLWLSVYWLWLSVRLWWLLTISWLTTISLRPTRGTTWMRIPILCVGLGLLGLGLSAVVRSRLPPILSSVLVDGTTVARVHSACLLLRVFACLACLACSCVGPKSVARRSGW